MKGHVSSAAFAVTPSYQLSTKPAHGIEGGELVPPQGRAVVGFKPNEAEEAVVLKPVVFTPPIEIGESVAIMDAVPPPDPAVPLRDLRPAAPPNFPLPASARPSVFSIAVLRWPRGAGMFRAIGRVVSSLRKPVLRAALGLASVELILQIAALALWYAHRPQPQNLVLCVGDSYTSGTGSTASEFSYPFDLGRLLRKSDKSPEVINAGWPDLDSRGTVLALPAQLLRFRPSLVYLVVGARDALTLPAPVAASIAKSASHNFPLLWRTSAFFGQFLNRSDSVAAKTSARYTDLSRQPEARGPAGTWLYQGQIVRIQNGGLLRFGDMDSHWEVHGNQLSTKPAPGNPSPPVQYQWERRDNVLIVKGGQFPNGLTLRAIADGNATPTPDLGDPLDEPVLAAYDQTTREEGLRQAIYKAKPEKRFSIRSDLARVYARNGKRPDAIAELAKMRPEMDASGDPKPMVDAYIDTAQIIGEGTEALRVARMFSSRFTADAFIGKTIAWESYRNRDFDSAAAAIEKALLLCRNGKARADILRVRAQILLKGNVPKSLESVIEAYAIDGDESALRRQLDPGLVLYDPKLLELSFDNVKASSEVRQGIRNAINKLKERRFGDIGWVMAQHLRLMVEMVRSTGAEVVFMSYPLAGDGYMNDVIRRVASEKQVGLVDLEAVFAERLTRTPKEDLFTPDDHLTNKGYALMAGEVAADIRRRKQ